MDLSIPPLLPHIKFEWRFSFRKCLSGIFNCPILASASVIWLKDFCKIIEVFFNLKISLFLICYIDRFPLIIRFKDFHLSLFKRFKLICSSFWTASSHLTQKAGLGQLRITEDRSCRQKTDKVSDTTSQWGSWYCFQSFKVVRGYLFRARRTFPVSLSFHCWELNVLCDHECSLNLC